MNDLDRRTALVRALPSGLVERQASAEVAADKALALPADAILTTPQQHAVLAEILTGIDEEHKALDGERKAAKAAHLKAADEVDEPRMETIRKLAEAKDHLKAIQAANLKAVAIAREVNAARAMQADVAGDSAAVAVASQLNGELAGIDTSTLTLVWASAKVDLARLPVQYLLADDKALAELGAKTPSNLAPPDVSGVEWELTSKVKAKAAKRS